MSVQVALSAGLLLALVVLVVGEPLRRASRGGEPAIEPVGEDPRGVILREDLEAEREAKYREIRDAELDYRTGKLSQEDYNAVDGTLRSQALEILDRLEDLGAASGGEGALEQEDSADEPVDD